MTAVSGTCDLRVLFPRVTGGELFEDIVAREYYSEADARWVQRPGTVLPPLLLPSCPPKAWPMPLWPPCAPGL